MIEVIVDSHLRMREIQMSDAGPIFKIINKDREYLRTWLPFVDYTRMVEDTERFIKTVHAGQNEHKEMVYVILNDNEIVGIIGFRNTDKTNHKTEIGYWLAQDQQGKGIVTRCVKALVALAFEKMRMNRVQIRVAVENQKSKAIPVRLGFKLEGREREGEYLNSHYVDLDVFGLLKKEWLNEANPIAEDIK